MKHIFILAAGALALIAMTQQPVLGHHGGAAYDQAKTLTMEGTVTEMTFANPHVLIYWDVKSGEAAGKWSGWLTAPNKLARAGWSKNTLKPGDTITVTGSAHKGGDHILQIRELIAPGGKSLPMFEQ